MAESLCSPRQAKPARLDITVTNADTGEKVAVRFADWYAHLVFDLKDGPLFIAGDGNCTEIDRIRDLIHPKECRCDRCKECRTDVAGEV